MDIIALHRQGLSMRAIARKLGMHRNTVKKYIEGSTMPGYGQSSKRPSILDPYRQLIDDYLAEDDYQATWLHDRLLHLGYQGSYKTVQEYVRTVKDRRTRLAYSRFETEPGLQAQMDWGDFQIANPDGTTTTVYLFLMVLGFSRTLYLEFVDRCTLEAFLDCHQRAFAFFQGVPAEILYDNMKHVVISRSGNKAIFNTELLHFAHHYGFQPKACPPYSPWVKGKAERPMDYVRQRFWRGYQYTTLERLNCDVLSWLERANQRRHGTHGQSVAERWRQEIPVLGRLPLTGYDTSIKVVRKVYKDCLIAYNGNRYLVPAAMVGRKVLLKIKQGVIRIYDDHLLLVTYQEAAGRNQLIGDKLFYEQLQRDQEQNRRKYGKSKGKATRGLSTSSLFPQVAQRPLSEYEKYAQGGKPWNN
ncbi:IS21 family transposase [Desulfobulbus rhabdoformis]|uniref:IS21 family transposase n=1 Tax=Desulfobulbus rhabdoformis TaxID=34032 RepID=UPI001962328A|nr:IS21 family transposase [Desulfobulbus rhabdoformis]MBM9615515.1 IS21 family transposase [Desulfobulbus rhabdoformis]